MQLVVSDIVTSELLDIELKLFPSHASIQLSLYRLS